MLCVYSVITVAIIIISDKFKLPSVKLITLQIINMEVMQLLLREPIIIAY